MSLAPSPQQQPLPHSFTRFPPTSPSRLSRLAFLLEARRHLSSRSSSAAAAASAFAQFASGGAGAGGERDRARQYDDLELQFVKEVQGTKLLGIYERLIIALSGGTGNRREQIPLQQLNQLPLLMLGGVGVDPAWLDMVRRERQLEIEKCELAMAQNTKGQPQIEKLRVNYIALAKTYEKFGMFEHACKAWFRAKDFSTNDTPESQSEMCLDTIKCMLRSNTNFADTHLYVDKLMGGKKTPTFAYELQCAGAISNIEKKRGFAATSFTKDVPLDLDTFDEEGEEKKSLKDCFSLEDIAIYGSLCALATFSRNEIRDRVINNQGFKSILELVPQMRNAVWDFHNSRYSLCFSALEEMRPVLLQDMYISAHVGSIFESIRRSALILYPKPFKSLSLSMMAEEVFGIPIAELEAEFASLIMQGRINARIDGQNKILYTKQPSVHDKTVAKALNEGSEFVKETRALIFRADLVKHQFTHNMATNEENQ